MLCSSGGLRRHTKSFIYSTSTLPVDQIEYCILYGIYLIFSKLPAFYMHLFISFLTLVAFDILRIRRYVVLKNLRQAFGKTKTEEQLIRIARKSYTNFGITFLEILLLRGKDSSFIRKRAILRACSY